jgi:predicted MPP superfamily phosphohydrolase
VSALQPDLVAITGDFMSLGGPDRVDEVARVLGHLAPPPLGCFAVLGNHDYGER